MEAIGAIFKIAVGLLVNKARDKIAEKLKDGDVADQKFRDMIARKIVDIKSDLAAQSKKDLSTSIAFLEEGILNMNQVFEKTNEQPTKTNEPSEGAASKAAAENTPEEETGKGKNSESLAKQVADTSAQATSLVTKHMQDLRTTDLNESASKSLADAKDRFKSARMEATKAFSNNALSAADRILALNIKLMATVLERVDRPNDALDECTACLKNLHEMKAVCEAFEVQLKGGMKSNLFQAGRKAIIVAVCRANDFVLSVKMICGESRESIRLPYVTVGSEKVDVLRDGRMLKVLLEHDVVEFYHGFWSFGQEGEEETRLRRPCDIATDSQGQFIVADRDKGWRLKVYIHSGVFQYAIKLQPKDYGWVLTTRAVTTDLEDNIYVLTEVYSRSPSRTFSERGFLKLLIYSKIGDLTKSNVLEKIYAFGDRFAGRNLTVNTSNSSIFVLGDKNKKHVVQVYNTEGEFIKRFGEKQLMGPGDITAAEDGRVFVLSFPLNDPAKVSIFSAEGLILQEFSLPPGRCKCSEGSIAFNQNSGNLIISSWGGGRSKYEQVSVYTSDGTLQHSMRAFDNKAICAKAVAVTSKGRIALLTDVNGESKICIVEVDDYYIV